MIARRSLAGLALGAGVLAAGTARAFPDRPLTMIVPYGPGGSNDVLGRVIATEMASVLGQNVVVENRPGAGGNIGAAQVAQQPRPDGHTFLFTASGLASSVSLMRLSFDPRRDLAPIAGVGAIPTVVVVPPQSPYRTLQDLLDAARARPGAINYGSSGPGTGTHLGTELLAAAANVRLTHVPYRGGSAAIYTDLLAGRLDMMLDILGAGAARVQQGQARALAVTSEQRSRDFPDIPTVAEQGVPGFSFATWFGFFAPAAAPPEALAQLEAAILRAMTARSVQERLRQAAADPISTSAAGFRDYFLADVERWAALVRAGRLERLD
jgi:tripartite-type tricarboxylate transporter receptor subunit TctC